MSYRGSIQTICDFYVFSIYFDKISYVFTTQVERLHSLFKSYAVLSGLPSQKMTAFK